MVFLCCFKLKKDLLLNCKTNCVKFAFWGIACYFAEIQDCCVQATKVYQCCFNAKTPHKQMFFCKKPRGCNHQIRFFLIKCKKILSVKFIITLCLVPIGRCSYLLFRLAKTPHPRLLVVCGVRLPRQRQTRL